MTAWKDTTSFSKGETDMTPRTWTRKIGKLNLCVTRHVHHEPDAWVASCRPLFDEVVMKSNDIDEAKCQATAKVQVELQRALKDILDS